MRRRVRAISHREARSNGTDTSSSLRPANEQGPGYQRVGRSAPGGAVALPPGGAVPDGHHARGLDRSGVRLQLGGDQRSRRHRRDGATVQRLAPRHRRTELGGRLSLLPRARESMAPRGLRARIHRRCRRRPRAAGPRRRPRALRARRVRVLQRRGDRDGIGHPRSNAGGFAHRGRDRPGLRRPHGHRRLRESGGVRPDRSRGRGAHDRVPGDAVADGVRRLPHGRHSNHDDAPVRR